MEFIILLLAQAADPADGLPAWAKYILGPLGTLVLMGVYGWWTEKNRIPILSKLLKDEQDKNDTMQREFDQEKEKLRKELRAELEGKLDTAQKEVKVCREKYTKERAARTWWQAQAQAKGVKEPLPEDIDKTSYGSFGD